MRRLLVVLDQAAAAPAALAAAALVAARLPGARIEVLHVRAATDPGFMPSEEVMTPARQARFDAGTAGHAADLHRIFAAWQHGSPIAGAATWRQESGDPAATVARDGDAVGLIVIGRGAHHRAGAGKALIDAAMFGTAAPVLLVPAAAPASVGAHVAVAWKPSETAERAVVAATPLLRRADTVTVLFATEGADASGPPPPLPDVFAALSPAPALHVFATGGAPMGGALLIEARRIGADLLVMGAYSRGRAVEALLGGATRDILADADLPVLLHH